MESIRRSERVQTVAEPTGPSTVDSEPTTTPTPTTAPTSAPEPIQDADPEAALAAWLAMWEGAELRVTDPAVAERTILAAADPAVFNQLDTIYNPDLASDVANSPRTFENSPVAEVQDDGMWRHV